MKQNRHLYLIPALIAIFLLTACAGQAPANGDTGEAPAYDETTAGDEPSTDTEGEVSADSLLGQVQQKGKLVVGTSADYPPYESVDENGEFVGFDMDIIREVGKRMGVEVEIQDMAFDALIASLQEGKIDVVIAAMQATEERDEQVDFTRPYHLPKDAFVVSGNSDITLEAPQDVADYNIGVQTGTAQERWVVENLVETGEMPESQLNRYERADLAALDLAAGRLDVLIIIADTARELAEQENLKIALETAETIAAGQAIAVPQGAAELKAELDRILEEMENEGVISDFQQQHNLP